MNWGTAKKMPATRQAGQTSAIPAKPAMAQTSQKGTITEKKGSCRPTIALSLSSGSPVTAARVMTGVPSAPKATGAVLPMSERPAAASGLNPRPMSMRRADGHRRAESGGALDEGAEARSR